MADGKASTNRTTFSRETSVSIAIQADPAIIWQLLTTGSEFASWNSTIISLEGDIKQGETIKLKSTLDEKRTFKLQIKELEPQKRLIWGDNQGSRTYTLNQRDSSTVTFSMSEKIGGFLFPLYSRFIPPFDASFEQFAADLKEEAERIQTSQANSNSPS